MTEYDSIQVILDRFMNGQTSEVEEARLARYFRMATDVPDEWQAYREMFSSFDSDAYEFSEQELDAMAMPVASAEQAMFIAPCRQSLVSRALRIAAMVAVVAGVGLVGYKKLAPPTPGDFPVGKPQLNARMTHSKKATEVQVVAVTASERQQVPFRKASAEAVANKAAVDTWQVAETPVSLNENESESLAAVATSCGSYVEADYAEILSRFVSLREYDQAHMQAVSSPQMSVYELEKPDTPVVASTDSPFDDDEVVSFKIIGSFPEMQ